MAKSDNLKLDLYIQVNSGLNTQNNIIKSVVFEQMDWG